MSYEIKFRIYTLTASQQTIKALEELASTMFMAARAAHTTQEIIALTADLESIDSALRQLRDDIKDSEEESRL